MEAAIEIKHMYFSYGKHTVLEDVNAGFCKHKFSVLLGTNGSGKSTLFKSITGLLSGYEGTVLINGQQTRNLSHKQKAALVGFLPQFYQTVFPFTVEDILLTGRAAFSGFSPTKEDRQMVGKVLNELDIAHLRKKLFTHLSGGEQQMVMMGRLLMQNPEIMILDEPINHLDVYYQHFLMDRLKALTANGHTVIAIMHNPTLAYQFADHFLFMHQKKIISSSHPGQPDLAILRSVYKTNFLNIEHNNLKIVLPTQQLQQPRSQCE